MFHDLELHKNLVSLLEAPTPNLYASLPTGNDVFTIGDLHANVVKLVHFLCNQQALAIEKDDYQQLLNLYEKFAKIAEKKNFLLLRSRNLKSIANDCKELNSILSAAKKEYDVLLEEIENIDSEIANTTDDKRLAQLNQQLKEKEDACMFVTEEYENANNELAKLQQGKAEYDAVERDLQNYAAAEIAADIQIVNEIIANLKPLSKPKIRLLGDDLADRGTCDAFIIRMVEKLKQEKIPYTIILSNHVMGFLERFYYGMGELRSLNPAAARSLDGLEYLCDSGILDKEKIKESVRKNYLPYLKLIDADLIDGGKGIIIYGHAGGDLPHIEAYAEKFAIPYKDETPQALAHTIDLINAAFQIQIVEQDKIHESYDCITCNNPNKLKDPIGFGLFNRNYNQLERPPFHPRCGYAMRWSHGHDSKKKDTEDHVIVLDDEVGKYAMTGQQTIIQTQSNPGLVLELRDENIAATTLNNSNATTTSHSNNNSGKNKMRIENLLTDPGSPTFPIGSFFPSPSDDNKKRKLTGDDAYEGEDHEEPNIQNDASNDYNPETHPNKASKR